MVIRTPKTQQIPTSEKIRKRAELAPIVASLREQGKIVGLTNGVFDILHAGHVAYLEEARRHCDCLIVSLNTDKSVKEYKDPGRPLVPQKQRARVVAALACVDYVTFHEERRMRKTLQILRPSYYIKGGDYKPEQLTSRDVVQKYGGDVLILPLEKGISTTAIIDRALEAYCPKPLSLSAPEPAPAPAIFLDRDGVINADRGYVSNPTDFEILPNVVEGLLQFQKAGYFIVIVTNQGGINLGYYTKEDFYRVNLKMLKILGGAGIGIDKIYFCPHTIKERCSCRKPDIGMILRAQEELPIIMNKSLMVGDKETDIQSGKKAGLKTCLISIAGKPENFKIQPDLIMPDLKILAEKILKNSRRRG